MNAKHEYEFIANFKILQNVFRAHKVEKVRFPARFKHSLCPLTMRVAHPRREAREVQDAVRVPSPKTHRPSSNPCGASPRDNLEFLQWAKRFWDSNYGGQGYDPVARRKGAPADPPATIAPLAPTVRSAGGLSAGGMRSGGKTPIGGHRSASTQPNEAVQALRAQLAEMSQHLEGLEKERDFYFAKVRPRHPVFRHLRLHSPSVLRSLVARTGCCVCVPNPSHVIAHTRLYQLRDIEILAQQQIEVLEADGKDDVTLREIQKILYSTEVC